MDGRFLILLPIAFAAGIVTAVSPCVFPVLPILFAGGASGGKRRPYAIIAGLVTSFATFTLIATVSWLRIIPNDGQEGRQMKLREAGSSQEIGVLPHFRCN